MTPTYILFGIVIFGLVTVIYFLYNQKREKDLEKQNQDSNLAPISQLNQNIQGLETRVNSKLEQVQASYSAINKELGVVQGLSQQMKDLNVMIKSPKLRGNIGEKLMEKLLADTLPQKSYQTQYQFRTGNKVDAIIKIQDEIVPIDSKFPIENFKNYQESKDKSQRKRYQKTFANDVRKHIRDINQKYIRTEEGTVNFAVMYVPSEMIYQAISRSESICDYANHHRVFITSPNHFYYFLQTILIGIERNKISKASLQILNDLKGIQREINHFGQNLDTLDKHLSNAKKQMDSAKINYVKIKDNVDSTASMDERQVTQPDQAELKEEEIKVEKIVD